MSKAVYIATMEQGSGKSIITLGVMRMLLGKVAKVGYFKPIIGDMSEEGQDNHINTITSYFNLDIECANAYAFTKSEVLAKMHEGKLDDVLDTIIEKYKAIEEQNDFVLVEGTDFSGEGTSVELEINSSIAKNIGIPVIIVERGTEKTLDEFTNNMLAAYDLFENNDVKVISVVANMVQPKNIKTIEKELIKKIGNKALINIIPNIEDLGSPTIKEVINALDAKVLFGNEKELNNLVTQTIVGAMQMRNFLPRLKKNALVIVPGDRSDLIMGALQANISRNYPPLAGVLLSGGIMPDPAMLKLAEGLPLKIPVILVDGDTFSSAQAVSHVHPKIYAANNAKIQLSIRSFDKYVNSEELEKALVTFEPKGITPRMFQYNLLKRAKKVKKRIVLPEGNDDRVLKAAAKLIEQNVVDLIILGEKEKMQRRVTQLGIDFDLDKVEVFNPKDAPFFDEYVSTFYELRKHKKVNMAIAEDKMLDVSYFGTMMVYKGYADGMVSGAAHPTQHTILPALQFIKTKPGVSVVSSIFFMCLEDRVSIFGDCAINPNPNAEQLAEIAISSADSSAAFGIEPKIAMLSYSSGKSGIGEDVEKVREATNIVKRLRPDLKIEGPIQYDAAVDPYIAGNKMPDSEVAGQASVLIFPDLNTGNNTYKAVQRETGTIAIGPMLQGLNKPVNDLSRGCLVEDIYNTVIIMAIQAAGL